MEPMSRPHGQRGPHRTGLTLVELTVAVTVLTVILLGFGVLLSQSQKVVVGSQSTMRANAAAAAVSDVIRRDMQQVTQQGFLARLADNSGRHRLIATVAGPRFSTVGNARGNGGLICIGARDKQDSEDGEFILWRAAFVLTPDQSENQADVFDYSGTNIALADLQAAETTEMAQWAVYLATNNDYQGAIAVPPRDAGDIDDLWQVLSHWCTDLQIDYRYAGESDWRTTSDWWTHHDQNAWPVAFRFRFTLTDPMLPEDMRGDGYDYEIICPVGR